MKMYRNIIIAVLVIAVLAGALILVNRIPNNEPENPQQTENQPKTEYIDIYRINKDDIKEITVKTQKSQYKVTKSGDTFLLSDSKDIKIDNQKLNSFVSSCSYVYAEKIVEEKTDDYSKYGLDTPASTVLISMSDGSSKTLFVGDTTIDAKSNYFKVEGDDKIYLKGAYSISTLAPDYNSFISLGILNVDTSQYQNLDQLNLKKRGNTAIEIKKVYENGTIDNDAVSWKMFNPAYADANGIVLSDEILKLLSSFVATGVIETRASNLKKFGLDNPYAELTIKVSGVTQKFIFGDEAEGYRFFMVDNFKSVYIVPTSSTTFLEVAYIDLMSRLVHLENIKYMSKVEVKGPNSNFLMEIDEEERHVNGIEFKKDEFSKLYQQIIGISFDSVDINAKKTKPADVTFKYTRTNGTTCTVEFVEINDRNYLALVDGKGSSIVNKNTVSDALSFIQEKLDAKK